MKKIMLVSALSLFSLNASAVGYTLEVAQVKSSDVEKTTLNKPISISSSEYEARSPFLYKMKVSGMGEKSEQTQEIKNSKRIVKSFSETTTEKGYKQEYSLEDVFYGITFNVKTRGENDKGYKTELQVVNNDLVNLESYRGEDMRMPVSLPEFNKEKIDYLLDMKPGETIKIVKSSYTVKNKEYKNIYYITMTE